MTNRSIIEEEEKWYDLAFKIPFLKFKPEWEVRIQPPFNGAMVRFRLRYKGNEISVYLDCYERLGCFGAPYWEMYPYKDDVARFALDDAENLIAAIDKQFNTNGGAGGSSVSNGYMMATGFCPQSGILR